MATATYTEFTRADLAGYDKECIEVALSAQSLGWTGRMSSKGHMILRAPDGESTMSVSRSSNGRSLANMKANLDRWKRRSEGAADFREFEKVMDKVEREQFIARLSQALADRSGEYLSNDDAAEVMRTVYTIVLEREEIAEFAFDLAKNQRIQDFGWLSAHPDDLASVRAWNVNWAIFDRRDGRVIDLGGPRTAPTGEEWSREFVEVKVAEQVAFERKYPDGLPPADEESPVPTIAEKDDRPYRCEICERTFKFPHNLGRHMSTIHKPDLEFVGEDPGLDDLLAPSEPVEVQMDDRLTIVVDPHEQPAPVESNQIGQDGTTAQDVASAMGLAIDSLSLVAQRMAFLENERGEYVARLENIRREYEDVVENLQQQVADLTAERDTARDSLAALKQIVSDL
jgi:hypothetical protein